MLMPSLRAEVGWLAPDGSYYTAPDRTSEWLHYDIAVELVKQFHPSIDSDDYIAFSVMTYSDVMWALGYVRVDLKMTMLLGEIKPTSAQLNKLFHLMQMKWFIDDAVEGIRQFLVEEGDGEFEFLRKPHDLLPWKLQDPSEWANDEVFD